MNIPHELRTVIDASDADAYPSMQNSISQL